MFQGWRIKLRKAEDAFRQGRLDEAIRLLQDDELRQYLPAQRLISKIAQQMADRARERAMQGETAAGWRDLQSARDLGGETEQLLAATRDVTTMAVEEAEKRLQAADPAGVLARVATLEQRGVELGALRALKEVARRLQSARRLMRRGKFVEAEQQLREASAVRPDVAVLAEQRRECRENMERSRQLCEQLHEAMSEMNWTRAVTLADHLLEMSPEHRLARETRSRAWAAVGAKVNDSQPMGQTHLWSRWSPEAASGGDGVANGQSSQAVAAAASPRFLLWVDAVGGYLVCMGEELTLGQAAPGNSIDIPIQADLSRHHASIRRQGEGYVLTPHHETRIAGRLVMEPQVLSDGDEIELGAAVRFRFRQPHALSATARLDLLTRHRTEPFADGVLLMAESCVLGPQPNNHVVCREWSGDVVLYRQDGGLYCRAMDSFEIDGQLCDGRGRLSRNSRVAGEEFSLSLEGLI